MWQGILVSGEIPILVIMVQSYYEKQTFQIPAPEI